MSLGTLWGGTGALALRGLTRTLRFVISYVGPTHPHHPLCTEAYTPANPIACFLSATEVDKGGELHCDYAGPAEKGKPLMAF